VANFNPTTTCDNGFVDYDPQALEIGSSVSNTGSNPSAPPAVECGPIDEDQLIALV